jgi:hypothetical protein
MMAEPKEIAIKAWDGFVDDELNTWSLSGSDRMLAIWQTREAARQFYTDVRPVEIIIKPAR